MGGELPPEVAKITHIPEIKLPKSKEKKNTAGFSLVAGYSDSEEEDSTEIKTIFTPEPVPVPKVSHSTLFPITQPVDVKDFQSVVEEKKEEEEKTIVEIDSKAFQRKKRIGVALINTPKKKENDVDDTEDARRGFGFKNDSVTVNKSSAYQVFEKGGVMFVKSDVLNPPLPPTNIIDVIEPEENAGNTKVEEMYSTLVEKLGFLNSGHPIIPPTQTMVIQAEVSFIKFP